MTVTVAQIEAAIASRFPVARAEAWDMVGLTAGDPGAEVTGVVLALDPTRAAIRTAAESGHNVLVTHHPPFLEPPKRIGPGPGAGGVLYEALSAGVALINAHTNLDRDTAGQLLLVDRLGFKPTGPLETSLQPMQMVTVYAPADAAESVTAAMIAAGAGRIGDYEGCSFRSQGEGRFTPAADSIPFTGSPETATVQPEERIELVCPPRAGSRVVQAAVAAHPYEEPLVTVAEVLIGRNAARLGHLSEAPAGMSLGKLAALTSGAFGVSAKVYGDVNAPVRTVATTTGSGTSMLPSAIAAGADVMVLGEVRYHDALDAAESGLAVIELGHDVTEWPLVSLLERVVTEIPGIDPKRVRLLPALPAWWTT